MYLIRSGKVHFRVILGSTDLGWVPDIFVSCIMFCSFNNHCAPHDKVTSMYLILNPTVWPKTVRYPEAAQLTKKKIDSSEAGASKIWSKAFVPNGVKTSPQVPGLKWSENISMSPWTIRGNNNKKEIFF